MIDKVLGIDVSKRKFDVALRWKEGKTRSHKFSNSQKGFRELAEWLKKMGAERVHACLEATGSYGVGLAKFLHGQAHVVSVVNPARIKAFGRSEGIRAKTDRVDAKLIARFCEAMEPRRWEPPAEELEELQGLVRRMESVQRMLSQERNRREAPGISPSVRESLGRTVRMLEGELERLREQLRGHLERHPELKQQQELLSTIPGIGEASANLMLSELCGRDFHSARELAAYAGLVPEIRESGSSVRGKGRLSKRGNHRLRRALWWPAIVAMRHNPLLEHFAQRLREAGKPSKLIIAAVMRKLLHIAFGVLKHQRPFDPNYSPSPS